MCDERELVPEVLHFPPIDREHHFIVFPAPVERRDRGPRARREASGGGRRVDCAFEQHIHRRHRARRRERRGAGAERAAERVVDARAMPAEAAWHEDALLDAVELGGVGS